MLRLSAAAGSAVLRLFAGAVVGLFDSQLLQEVVKVVLESYEFLVLSVHLLHGYV